MPFCRPEASSRKRRGSRVLIAAAALLCFAGCANQGAPLIVEGKLVSGQVRLTQEQVGNMGGLPLGPGQVGFHRPTYLAGGRLNVGTGVLDGKGLIRLAHRVRAEEGNAPLHDGLVFFWST